MEQFLSHLWQKWQWNGTSPHAEPLVYTTGWSLSLCFRARLTAWIFFVMFAGGFVGVLLLQEFDPQPQKKFLVLLGGYLLIASLGVYYLVFVHWYRVTIDENNIELRRFLIPRRIMAWDEVAGFEYAAGEETMRIVSHDNRKLGLYLSLHGLSAVRRCLARLPATSEQMTDAWATCDQLLMQDAPSWRCSDEQLQSEPFQPLS